MKPKTPASGRDADAAGHGAPAAKAKREPKTIATLLSRASGQRGSPAGKGRGFPAAKGKDKRHAVSNGLQSHRRSARSRKTA